MTDHVDQIAKYKEEVTKELESMINHIGRYIGHHVEENPSKHWWGNSIGKHLRNAFTEIIADLSVIRDDEMEVHSISENVKLLSESENGKGD